MRLEGDSIHITSLPLRRRNLLSSVVCRYYAIKSSLLVVQLLLQVIVVAQTLTLTVAGQAAPAPRGTHGRSALMGYIKYIYTISAQYHSIIRYSARIKYIIVIDAKETVLRAHNA